MREGQSDQDVAIRDVLFEHEMFEAKRNGGIRYGTDSIRCLEAGWAYELEELMAEFKRMVEDGLVKFEDGGIYSTQAGRIERERRWKMRGKRNSLLTTLKAAPRDLLVAVISSAGYESDDMRFGSTLSERELEIYLPDIDPEEKEAILKTLISEGVVGRRKRLMDPDTIELGLTAKGIRHYAQQVVPLLGLKPPATILAPEKPDSHLFDELSLPAILTDNLLYRWQEAERCTEARAWLGANIMYCSILEAVLPEWLGRFKRQAIAAKSAPKDKKGNPLPLNKWSLACLIEVSVELELVDSALARYADALRGNRNLIHPELQMRERSCPDGDLTAISKQIVMAVLAAMARAV